MSRGETTSKGATLDEVPTCGGNLRPTDWRRAVAQQLLGASDEAYAGLLLQIDQIRNTPAVTFGLGTDGAPLPQGQQPQGAEGFARFVRRLAGILSREGDTLGDMAQRVHDVVGFTEIGPEDVRTLLEQHPTTLADIRRCCWALRDGYTVPQVMELTGASRKTAQAVQMMLGSTSWHKSELDEAVQMAVDAGWNGRELSEWWSRNGPPAAPLPERTARVKLAAARERRGDV